LYETLSVPCTRNRSLKRDHINGNKIIETSFLAATLDGGGWLASCPVQSAPGEGAPITHWMGSGWSPEQVWAWCRKKNPFPETARNQTPIIWPVG